MKAARLFGKNKIKIVETPVPKIGDEEILVKVKAASICGSDIRMVRNGYRNVDEDHPLTLGHEFAGDIVEVGRNVMNYKTGQRISAAPNYGCGICDQCVSGNTHLCGQYRAFGISVDGGLAEYVRIPAEMIRQGNVMVLDQNISYEEAALVEPLSCVYNGHLLLQEKRGGDVLIIGMGPIGIMHIMVAKLFGAGKIFINDLNVERMHKAAELFPDVYMIEGDILKGLHRYGLNGVDTCVIAAPAAAAQSASLAYMNMNGKLLFFGGLPEANENVSINTNLIHYRQLTIQGCTKQSISEYRICSKLVNDKRIPLKAIVSDTYRIDQFSEAMDHAMAARGLKHIIMF